MSCSLGSLVSCITSLTPSVSDSVERLLAQSRAFLALYQWLITGGCDHPSGSRTEWIQRLAKMFRVLYKKESVTTDFSERSRLLSAMYLLTGETELAYEQAYIDRCHTLSERLFADYEQLLSDHRDSDRNDPFPEALFCRNITDYYYPEAAVGDEWFDRYQAILGRWASQLASSAAGWQDVDDNVALTRMEVMNRNSYMFRDRQYDVQIAQVYRYYMPRLLHPEQLQRHSMYMLGACYDVVMQGNAYPIDRHGAAQLAEELERRMQLLI
ncbi:MAG: hypothetical protein LBN06_05225 [Prevotellaceae bacterium]|jgi:hypothetical protein|nr:hypothetical protein [Prevotellaceae bacterium]